MQKEFKFNFSKVEVPQTISLLNSNPVLQQAAFFTRFTISELEAAVVDTDKISEREIELIHNFSNKPNSRQQFSIKDTEKNLVFRTLGLAGMKNWLHRLNLDSTDTTQSMLTAYINGEAPDLNKQSLPQLIATHSVCNWLKETDVKMPDELDVMHKIRQLEILKPFQALTINFKGRVNDLARLSDYVDWRPKSTVLGSMQGWLRNIISWHDKPPLMITGIGGSGKSTLMAKFVLDELEYKQQKLPFVYFDFDKPGLSVSNPLELAIDALQQLSVQFPKSTSIFDAIREQLQNDLIEFESDNHLSYITHSRGSDRLVYYEKYTEQYAKQISEVDKPVLVIFDSFEELQYRANTSEINTMFSFIREISDIIPRLRPVFIGRAEVTFGNMRFEPIQLEDFDQAAAIAFLESRGVANTKLGEIIFQKVGGNPLTLKLMAEMVRIENILDPKQVIEITGEMDKTLLQELLVKRNLEHIHDADTSKIAVPGILVRRINPDIIKHVLAEPCGFSNLTDSEAEHIFSELNKESFLVVATADGISFRQDLRIALYKLIINSTEYKGREIHNKAVKYYSGKADPHSRAEKLYHCLMRGDNPENLNHLYDDTVRPYIENSLPELPDNAYLYLSRKMGIRAADSKVSQASLLEWENYQHAEIVSLMYCGDDATLNNKRVELAARTERTWNSVLHYQEAKLETRLANFKNANKIIDKALKEVPAEDNGSGLNLLLLKATIYEYQMNFREAFNTVNDASILEAAYGYILNNDPSYLKVIVEARLTWARLARRIGEEQFSSVLNSIYKFIAPFEKQIYGALKAIQATDGLASLLPFPYKTYVDHLYGQSKSEPNFRELFVEMDRSFSASETFISLYNDVNMQVKTKSDLERLLRDRYKLNLKDICEPGALEVNLIDVVKFTEMANNKLQFKKRNNT